MFRWISGFIFFIHRKENVGTDFDVVRWRSLIDLHLSKWDQLCGTLPGQDLIPDVYSHLQYKWMKKKKKVPDGGWISTQDGVIMDLTSNM